MSPASWYPLPGSGPRAHHIGGERWWSTPISRGGGLTVGRRRRAKKLLEERPGAFEPLFGEIHPLGLAYGMANEAFFVESPERVPIVAFPRPGGRLAPLRGGREPQEGEDAFVNPRQIGDRLRRASSCAHRVGRGDFSPDERLRYERIVLKQILLCVSLFPSLAHPRLFECATAPDRESLRTRTSEDTGPLTGGAASAAGGGSNGHGGLDSRRVRGSALRLVLLGVLGVTVCLPPVGVQSQKQR